MAAVLFGIAGWYFLPSLVTGYVQTALYSIFIRAGDPKPAPGTPRYVRDRRRIHIAVIVSYLLYTIYEADYQVQQFGDFYRLLGVGYDVDERGILSRFRRLTVQFHPDKATGPDRDSINDIYVQLQLARDTLADPGKRIAYDRFGPEIFNFLKSKSTGQDLLLKGLKNIGAFYVASFGFLSLVSMLGYMRSGTFWRFLLLVVMSVIEVQVATRSTFPFWLTKFVNPICVATGLRPQYLPFQVVALMRKIAVTFTIAVQQLGPLMQDPRQAQLTAAANHPGGVDPQLLQQIDALTNATDAEVARLMGFEMNPFVTKSPSPRKLNVCLKEWIMQNNARNDPEVAALIRESLERRRTAGELT